MVQTRKNLETALEETPLRKSFKVVSAYRRHPNLKDLLVQTKLYPPNSVPHSPGRFRTATNPTTKTTYTTQRNITLRCHNCVYMIRCKKCRILYIGETRNSLSTRLSQHRYNVRSQKKSSTHLVQHFTRHGVHNIHLEGLEHNPNWSTPQRRRAEALWIAKLGTRFPHGLNAPSTQDP